MVVDFARSIFHRFVWSILNLLDKLLAITISVFPGVTERRCIRQLGEMGVVVYKNKMEKLQSSGLGSGSGSSLNPKHNLKNPINLYVKDNRVIRSAARNFSKYALEDYVTGLWDCDALEEFLCRLFDYGIRNKLSTVAFERLQVHYKFLTISSDSVTQNWETARRHYDYGNEHWRNCLGNSMVYSGGYWENAKNLDEAQINKMDLIARKLHLKPGMKVMDLGCGWGGFSKFLAEKYKVDVVGVTNSVEGAAFSSKMCEGLSVDIKVCDFRDIPKLVEGQRKFDRIVSIELLEHIGLKNYKKFFQCMNECLTDDGFILLQVMLRDRETMFGTTEWTQGLVPHVFIPYHIDILKELEHIFSIQDLHSFGPDFYKSAIAWRENLVKNWPEMVKANLYKEHQADNVDLDTIFRTWYLFFTVLAVPFRLRQYQLWHFVLTKVDYPQVYKSVR